MAENRTREVIEYFRQRLAEKGVRIAKIIVFGSQVTGNAAPESDIDFVVVSADFQGKDIFDRVEMTKKAETETIRKFMVPLDVIPLTPDEFDSESSLIATYAKKGEVIFGPPSPG